MDEAIKKLHELIQDFRHSLEKHLPALEQEVQSLIQQKCTDAQTIERYLDILLALTQQGIGDKLYIQLLDYYKTIDAEGALYYWKEYDEEE